MIATVFTGALTGLEAYPITVEVDLPSGLPGLTIVGLPDAALNDAKERIKAAIKNSGYPFPMKKVVINLAPAAIRKEGPGFDLPLAVGILLASEVLSPTEFLKETCFIGELSLNGDLRRIHGVLSMAMMAKAEGFKYLVVPEENLVEASLVEGIEVFGLSSLKDLPLFLLHPHSFAKPIDRQVLMREISESGAGNPTVDFAHVKGQEAAKRALELAAAGGHNVLMIGPPGSGKSMLAKAFSGILPPMSFEEVLEVSRVYSVAGLLNRNQNLVVQRPFRSPHHSASVAGVTGGGNPVKPGEISLAHRGVLFLDEFVEFNRNVIEILRQPLEDGEITISRVNQNVNYPAKFILVAAMNPCPCGFRGDTSKRCTCSEAQAQKYFNKVSGPLLDRIDLHLEVPRLNHEELLEHRQSDTSVAETSAQIRERVSAARERQLHRFRRAGIYCNAEMTPNQVRTFCTLDGGSQELFRKAIQKFQLSARAFDRILRVSRTIADLEGLEEIQSYHLAEALQYRGLQRLIPAEPVVAAPGSP